MTEQKTYPTADADSPGLDAELLQMLIALGEEKKVVFGTFLTTTICALLVSFVLPVQYTARTVILPPQKSESAAASALAGIGALAGGNVSVKTPDGMYLALLKSRSTEDGIIEHFQLRSRYHSDGFDEARNKLERQVSVTLNKKSGLLTVEAKDGSAPFSAELANGYFEELQKQLDRIAVTDAQQQVKLYQVQIERTKRQLYQAEAALNEAQRVSGVVSLDSQVTEKVQQAARIRAQISAHEVQLQSLSAFATPQNASVQVVRAELNELQNQLSALEQGQEGADTANDTPGLENIRAFREVRYQEEMLGQLTKQLMMSQVDEAREGPLLQQVDVAVVPERKSWPRRGMIVSIGAALGLLLGLGLAFSRRYLRSHPDTVDRLQLAGKAWVGRSGV